jgi:hypothetical protein
MRTNTTRNVTEFEIGIEIEVGIEIGKLIDYLFFIIYILYFSTSSWSTHASPASTRTSHLWFHNVELAQRILDPMTFEYFLAIENTQRTKPSCQRMNNLT